MGELTQADQLKKRGINSLCGLELRASFQGIKTACNGKGETPVATVKCRELGETLPRS